MKQRFEIVVREQVAPGWAEVFNGMEVTCRADGDTLLAGEVPDQAALYGLLLRLRDLGLTLVSVNSLEL